MTVKYYLVQVDWEYMADNEGDYTLLKTKAARLRPEDHEAMEYVLKQEGVRADLVPTSYKLGENEFLDPRKWQRYYVKMSSAYRSGPRWGRRWP